MASAMGIRALVTAALFIPIFLPPVVFAQTTGEAGASIGLLEEGGPDAGNTREDSAEGVSISGRLTLLGHLGGLHADWHNLALPDFSLRGAFFSAGVAFDASAVQRAYLAGGDARFAWDSYTGLLDERIPPVLARYEPMGGSIPGRFAPGSLALARDLLPEGSPGWAIREVRLHLRTLGKEAGASLTVAAVEREGTAPRSFVVATGFTPFPSTLTRHLPVGEPLGVIEVPERISERDFEVRGSLFATRGKWRWEAEGRFGRYLEGRPVQGWENPFQGPDLLLSPPSNGSHALLRIGGRGPSLDLSAEERYKRGEGEAGEREIRETKVRARWSKAMGGVTWFALLNGTNRRDSVSAGRGGPHPIYQGPFYRLLGPRVAEAPTEGYPLRQWSLSGGARGKAWELSGRLTERRTPEAYAAWRRSFEFTLSASPWKGASLTLRPFWTRTSEIQPWKDLAGSGGEWRHGRGFKPENGRPWTGYSAKIRWSGGPGTLLYSSSSAGSSGAPGLQSRRFEELFGSLNLPKGEWDFSASVRATRGSLALDATTYAALGDALDPADPSHRLPFSERWRREGVAGVMKCERDLAGFLRIGLRAKWDRQRVRAGGRIGDDLDYSYLRSGLYLEKGGGPLPWRIEAGAEEYRLQDPAVRFEGTPAGPYLWAGITGRPGLRGYFSASFSMKF